MLPSVCCLPDKTRLRPSGSFPQPLTVPQSRVIRGHSHILSSASIILHIFFSIHAQYLNLSFIFLCQTKACFNPLYVRPTPYFLFYTECQYDKVGDNYSAHESHQTAEPEPAEPGPGHSAADGVNMTRRPGVTDCINVGKLHRWVTWCQ